MLVVNFKAYAEGIGKNAEELAQKCIEASKEFDHELVLAVQPEDILRFEGAEADIFAQHVDAIEAGSHTGHVLPEGVKQAGAGGTLVNHSERRLEHDEIQNIIQRADELGLTTIVCAQTPEECGELSNLGPDYIAFEPPELIGGDTAVSEAEPELIEKAVENSSVDVLTGAGIKDTEDVKKSVELGCVGVLVASGIVKADNPQEEVKELMNGL